MKQIQDAIMEGNYKLADDQLQDYMRNSAKYDDSLAILDAAVGSHYGDRLRVWEAVRKGLMYNCRNYELYVTLGDYYLQDNSLQSYLCYENALFYCNDPDDRLLIQGILTGLQQNYGIFMAKTAIVIRPGASLEHMKLCVESIRMTTPGSARKIVAAVEPHANKESLEWLGKQEDIKIVKTEREKSAGYKVECSDIEGMDIFLLAGDALLTENALFWLRMGLYEKEKHGMAGCVLNVRENQQMASGVVDTPDVFAFGEKNNIPQYYPYEERLFFSGTALLIKRFVWDQLGPLDQSLGKLKYEDYGLRVLSAGYQNILCKNSFVMRLERDPVLEQYTGYVQVPCAELDQLNEKWGFRAEYYLGIRQDLPGLIAEPKEKALNILEIGCGCGAMMGYIRGMFPNARTYGVELIPEVALIAAHLGEVLCGDIEKMELPWEEEYFDYVIMGDVLEHLMNPEEVLRKLRKYLKTGGHIIISMPNVKHYSVLLPLLRWDVFPYGDSGILDRTHVKMYTGTEIHKLVLRSGYKIEALGYHSYSKPTEQEEQMLDILESFLDGPSKESFLAYQYILKAVK
ncbi:MAG: methyltransferase domain-containing protein [Lachnospiraceae bacterium]|nr:methyltransferase domain-containing protein [Lachnospiraceae bacterium]